jgi:hypothetical protein
VTVGTTEGVGGGVRVGVRVGVGVAVGVGVPVGVGVTVGVGVFVGVGVTVGVCVEVGVTVGVGVLAGVGVIVGVRVTVGVIVGVGVHAVGVSVKLAVKTAFDPTLEKGVLDGLKRSQLFVGVTTRLFVAEPDGRSMIKVYAPPTNVVVEQLALQSPVTVIVTPATPMPPVVTVPEMVAEAACAFLE